MSQASHSQPNEVDARADLASYLILGSIFVFMALVCGVLAIRGPRPNWGPTCVIAAVGVSVMLWLKSIRLKIACGELWYSTLFGTHSIQLADIERAETQVISAGRGAYPALVIHLRQEARQKPLVIRIKVFSREDLARVFDLLGSKFHGPRRIGVYTDETV